MHKQVATDSPHAALKRSHAPWIGSCRAAGHTSCCLDGDCHGQPANCYCDANCVLFKDCCSDTPTDCPQPGDEQPTSRVPWGECMKLHCTLSFNCNFIYRNCLAYNTGSYARCQLLKLSCPAATQHCNFFKDGHPCNHCSIMLLRDEEETYTCLAVYRYMVDEQIFSSIRPPFLTPEPRQHSSAAKVQGLSAMHLYTGWVTGLWSALSSTILVCCLGL